jgi:arylsulfatase A-like enzyme
VRAGGDSAEVVGNIDLAPTILQIAGVARGDRVDGRSLLPYLADPTRRSRRPLLLEAFNPADVSAARDAPVPATEARAGPLSYSGIVTGRYKLIRYRDFQIELYDLARDPDELNSLDESPAYNGVRRYLRRALTAREDCAGTPCSLPLRTAPPKPVRDRNARRG